MHEQVSILLAEDDDVDAEAVTRAIRKRKILNDIIRVKNGLEALEALRAGHIAQPRIILLDLNMPRLSGLDFLQILREDEDLKREVVFVLTTSNLDQDKIAVYDLNVAGYVLKDNAGEDFESLLIMLDSYWRVVELPVD